jgi:hypothetical protein
MSPETLAALDALCRRAVGRSLDASPAELRDADEVAAELFALAQELGPRETAVELVLDEDAEAIAAATIRAAVATGSFGGVRVATPAARDELREYVKWTLIAVQALAEAQEPYGPVPSGLQGRDLGLAALALEILENRTPQRLLDRQRRSGH